MYAVEGSRLSVDGCLMAVRDPFLDTDRGKTGEAAIGFESRFRGELCTFPIAGRKYSA
jgi:hypothetical protein